MTIKRTFSAKLKLLPDMVEYVKKEARRTGFNDKALFKIELAAEEVLVNVINYAYPECEGEVQILLIPLERGGLEILILDEGRPFNPLSFNGAQDENTSIDERAPGGWGLTILRKTADELEYKHDGTYNRLSLRLFLASHEPVAE